MDQQLDIKYENQIRTLQRAIKTQNDVLINKIQTILNQATLDAFKILDLNLQEFQRNYKEIRNFQYDKQQLFAFDQLEAQIQTYIQCNLQNLRDQISNSIGGLQEGKPEDDQVSSLLDVMSLLLKASDLYTKNLKEAVQLPPLISMKDKCRLIQNLIGGVRDGRITQWSDTIVGIHQKELQQLKCSQIFDIFPLLQTNRILVATYENELFIFDLELRSVILKLEQMRFVPCSCLQLQKMHKNQIRNSNLMLLGGSEFDPNIYLYDMVSGKKIQTFPGHDKSIRFIVQLGDLNSFVSLGRDSKMYFWNLIKGEPHQILVIPTIEIIEMQMQVSTQCLFTQSIDGKICVIQLKDDSEKFKIAEIVNLIELNQTSSLSQMLVHDQLNVIAFSSGWLTGQNCLKIYGRTPLQQSYKMRKNVEINLDQEISQLNTIINKDKFIIACVDKISGKLNVFLNGGLMDIIEQNLPEKEQKTPRWNIKIIYIQNKPCIVKFGQDNQLQIYEFQYNQ